MSLVDSRKRKKKKKKEEKKQDSTVKTHTHTHTLDTSQFDAFSVHATSLFRSFYVCVCECVETSEVATLVVTVVAG